MCNPPCSSLPPLPPYSLRPALSPSFGFWLYLAILAGVTAVSLAILPADLIRERLDGATGE